jgi:hypothetical protein
MADHGMLEKGNGNVVGRDPLAKEVYGIDVTDSREGSEELATPSKVANLGLRTRALINKIGAEERGIERVPEELRTNQHPFSLFTLWSSANVGTATLAFGTLGPGLFFLGWWDSFLCLLFFNIIGAIPPALMATLGPKLGLRTMTVQRFSFGTLYILDITAQAAIDSSHNSADPCRVVARETHGNPQHYHQHWMGHGQYHCRREYLV